MKKRMLWKRLITCIAILSMFFNSAFADYTDGPGNSEYSRTKAAQYIYKYTITPNSAYYDFTNIGGDCTNFVSQVLAAGGMSMTHPVYNPTIIDWYYYGPTLGAGRTATWTNANCFSYYWIDINDIGLKKAYAYVKYCASEFNNDSTWYEIYSYLEPGDIIQFMSPDCVTYHSQAVHRASYENGELKVSVGQHTINGWRNLRDYISVLPVDTVICLIKVKQPSSKDAGYLGSYKGKTVSELDSSEDYLFNLIPTDEAQENEKWSRISAIKEELVSRVKCGVGIEAYKVPITKKALLNFIGARIENNNNIENSLIFSNGLFKCNIESICECKKENKKLEKFLRKVRTVKESDKERVIVLWNEFWNEIVEQNPPLYFE